MKTIEARNENENEIHVVMAHRSSSSMFGSAVAPLKADGKILHFTKAEAEAEAARLNSETRSANVHYSVAPLYTTFDC